MSLIGNAKRTAKAGLLLAGILVLVPGGSAFAQEVKDTNVQVLVCPASPGANLVITSPQDDTVINTRTVTVKGEVHLVSQIEFYIGDTYNNTLAIGAGDTTFEETINLPAGTHTIKLVGRDSCFPEAHRAAVVVTYQPKATPSNGSDTPTIVPGGTPSNPSEGTGFTAANEGPASEDGMWTGFLPGPIVRPVEQLWRGLDLDTSIGGETLHESWKLISVLVGAVLLSGVPIYLVPEFVKKVWHKNAPNSSSSAHKKHRHWGIRSVGFLLLVAPFIM